MRCHCEPRVTYRTPSRRCADDWWSRSPVRSHDVRVAPRRSAGARSMRTCDAVKLILLSHVFADSWRLWICYFADSASAERRMAGTMEPLAQSSEARFADYVDALTTVMGRGDRAGPLKDYCVGLLMPGERKSVEPMAEANRLLPRVAR